MVTFVFRLPSFCQFFIMKDHAYITLAWDVNHFQILAASVARSTCHFSTGKISAAQMHFICYMHFVTFVTYENNLCNNKEANYN